MKVIHHRRNTIEELKSSSKKHGIEIDIRSEGKNLIIQHDPFVPGVYFGNWISFYKHKTLILNVKEEGLESKLIQIMNSRNINDYFFLDQSFPSLVKWANLGERRCAIRVSEFEPIETALLFAGKLDWVWVDCFTHFPLTTKDFDRLKKGKFKIYLVSPELQGRNSKEEIESMIEVIKKRKIEADAVCTKYPDLWESFSI